MGQVHSDAIGFWQLHEKELFGEMALLCKGERCFKRKICLSFHIKRVVAREKW